MTARKIRQLAPDEETEVRAQARAALQRGRLTPEQRQHISAPVDGQLSLDVPTSEQEG